MSYMALSVSEGIVGKILIPASKLFLDFSILVYTEFKDRSWSASCTNVGTCSIQASNDAFKTSRSEYICWFDSSCYSKA